jgi:endonuclease/exonuclease/phosphatase family metal-dependent hydrolase
MHVATWNVLHRVHAENWDEDLDAYPREADRQRAVASLITQEIELGASAIGLQECSGDQLSVLRASLPEGVRVLDFALPRQPRIRAKGRLSQLSDESEHLVVLALANLDPRPLGAAAFDTDPGKGWIAVDLAGVAFVSVHVSWGEHAASQFERLRQVCSELGRPAVLVGDFNLDRASASALLGDGFRLLSLPAGLRTRPRSGSTKSQVIDHIAVLGGEPTGGAVVDAAGASDHNLVRATVRFDP